MGPVPARCIRGGPRGWLLRCEPCAATSSAPPGLSTCRPSAARPSWRRPPWTRRGGGVARVELLEQLRGLGVVVLGELGRVEREHRERAPAVHHGQLAVPLLERAPLHDLRRHRAPQEEVGARLGAGGDELGVRLAAGALSRRVGLALGLRDGLASLGLHLGDPVLRLDCLLLLLQRPVDGGGHAIGEAQSPVDGQLIEEEPVLPELVLEVLGHVGDHLRLAGAVDVRDRHLRRDDVERLADRVSHVAVRAARSDRSCGSAGRGAAPSCARCGTRARCRR